MPHLFYTLSAAVLISVVTAMLGRRPFGERVNAALYLVLFCAVTTLAGSWLMYWIHG
jgi:hypothetical protein